MSLTPPTNARRFDYRSLLAIVVLGGVFWAVLRDEDALAKLRSVSVPVVFALALIHGISYLGIAWAHRACLKAVDVSLTTLEWTGLTFVTALYDLFLPARAGLLFRAWYLEKRKNFPYLRFAGLVLFLTVLAFTLTGALGAVAFHGSALFVPALLLLVGGPIGLWLVPKSTYAADWRQYRRPRHLSGAFLGYAAVTICGVARIALALQSLHFEISPQASLQAALGLMLVSSIPLLPGNMGIREAALSAILIPFHLSVTDALIVSLIDRAAQLVVVVPLGLGFHSRLMHTDRSS